MMISQLFSVLLDENSSIKCIRDHKIFTDYFWVLFYDTYLCKFLLKRKYGQKSDIFFHLKSMKV